MKTSTAKSAAGPADARLAKPAPDDASPLPEGAEPLEQDRPTSSQVAANRQNARRSTGPKTKAGKAAVARNSLGHGIYAVSPVVEGAETVEAWNDYRAAMWESFEPQGMLEETLAERLILNAWRLRRIARYETGQILREINENKAEDLGGEQEALGHREFLHDFSADGDNTEMSFDDAQWLLEDAFAYHPTNAAPDNLTDEDDGLDEYMKPLEAAQTCTVGLVRQQLERIAKRHEWTAADLLGWILSDVEEKIAKNRQELAAIQCAHLVPHPDIVAKVMRYESHLSRMFRRDLHELQRLQALRKGQPVAAPMVVDVGIAGIPRLEEPESE
jgi:hypothetical protein